MIYCVVPVEFEEQLFEKLSSYYAADANVEVIVDRREGERRGREAVSAAGGEDREQRDRRRQRITGEFPPLEPS